MAGPEAKPLKLVQEFADSKQRKSADAQSGYEKVDDNRVLERCFYPLRWRDFDKSPLEMQVVVTLFDFKSFTATVTRETVDRNGGLIGEASHTEIPFSAFENRAALAEAHRALVELGGSPFSIAHLLEEDVSTKKPITPLKPLRLNRKDP